MTDRFLSRALAAVMVAAALAVAACGGSASPSPAATPAGSGAPSAAPSEAPSAATTGEPTEAPSVEPSQEPQASFDIGGLTDKVSKFKSYKTAMSMTGVASVGELSLVTIHQTVPVKQEQFEVKAAGTEMSIISIEGKGTWVNQGTGWTEVPEGTAASMTSGYAAFAPDVLLQSFNVDEMFGALDALGVEQRNGVSATHYKVNAAKLATLPNPSGAPIPADLKLDLWIAQGNEYVVALEFSATTVDAAGTATPVNLKLDVSNVDDASLQVAPPK